MVFAHAQYDYWTCSAKIFHPAAGPIDTAFSKIIKIRINTVCHYISFYSLYLKVDLQYYAIL